MLQSYEVHRQLIESHIPSQNIVTVLVSVRQNCANTCRIIKETLTNRRLDGPFFLSLASPFLSILMNSSVKLDYDQNIVFNRYPLSITTVWYVQ